MMRSRRERNGIGLRRGFARCEAGRRIRRRRRRRSDGLPLWVCMEQTIKGVNKGRLSSQRIIVRVCSRGEGRRGMVKDKEPREAQEKDRAAGRRRRRFGRRMREHGDVAQKVAAQVAGAAARGESVSRRATALARFSSSACRVRGFYF